MPLFVMFVSILLYSISAVLCYTSDWSEIYHYLVIHCVISKCARLTNIALTVMSYR
jgi:hypothetical protein